MMALYHGRRTANGPEVTVARSNRRATALRARGDLAHHGNAGGFDWGFPGSAPARLALALAADVVSDEVAVAVYRSLYARLVIELPRDEDWTISRSAVRALCKSACRDHVAGGG